MVDRTHILPRRDKGGLGDLAVDYAGAPFQRIIFHADADLFAEGFRHPLQARARRGTPFDFGTGIASLTAGGQTIFGTTALLGETLDRFALRQSDSSTDETITIDNLVVSNIPLPAGLPLLLSALAGLGFLRRRA